MTQKDNVKQLIGKSLNAYNNKVLQQIDRIEKKNKQQNHKISMLTNELDNDYLTKTEEGSVISLEHSKEGMVYIDSLEGNTLVNYCTDGSKELTLNGDIDLEGTFVTTTEGVDNGKVDVMCEGNTLVNCIKDASIKDVELIATTNGGFVQSPFYTLDKFLFKPNTVYTFVALLKENTIDNSVQLCCSHSRTAIKTTTTIKTPLSNTIIFTFTTKEDFTGVDLGLYHQLSGCTSGKLSFTQMILEGDWTDKEIPPYFEGMKSVGQDDENGHKIEILSRNDKLIINKDKLLNEGIFYGTKGWSAIRLVTKAKRVKIVVTNKDGLARQTKLSVKNDIESEVRARQLFGMNESFNKVEIDYELLDTNILSFCVYGENDFNGDFFDFYDIEVFSYDNIEDVTPTTRYNKKEILLNEPLRGLPNGVKDRFVKLGGKLFIERNCSTEFNLADYNFEILNQDDTIIRFRASSNNFSKLKHSNNGVCNILNYHQAYNLNHSSIEGIGIKGDSNYVLINLNKSRNILSVDDLKNFIKNGLVFSDLQTPTYEPLETNPELLVYNDTTHISNNSIIPCNMKIQNSGYNAIIKPSTLYTVALDTNKSGTIGMNLGGAKGTTTNNVLTLTTPATLTDDSLRLYGKGIKGSKVRLLEGDKTNWIPSHFEGMKSSFEDKLQDDGTYKMEILSNNKNLFNENILEKVNSNYYEIINKDNRRCLKIERPSLMFRTRILNQLKKNTSYKINFDMLYDRTKGDGLAQGVSIHIVYTDGTTSTCYASNSYNEWLNANITTPLNKTISYIQFSYGTNTPTYIDLDTFIIQENNNLVDYVYHKSNKIQFSSIEPLRGIGEIKDRFVFKDNKLMIERNCCTGSLDGTASIYHCWTNNRNDIVSGYIYYHEHKPEITNIKQHSNVVCTDLPNNRGGHISTVEGFRNTSYFTFSIHKSKLGIEDINAGEENQNIVKRYFTEHPLNFVYQLAEPTYEEIPFELQKIILEGYENGTLFFDTNIPPTSTITYAGETPIVKSVRLNKTEVSNNTNDINDNIIPYLMDMDYRVVCLELATETQGISMAKLFGGVYEMLKRDILSGRLTKEEYGYRLTDYFNAGKLTEEQVRELEDLR